MGQKQFVSKMEMFYKMEEYKELAVPFELSLKETGTRKLFNIVFKMLENAGLDDLQDLEKIFEILKEKNALEQKKRIWGFKYQNHITKSQFLDEQILNYLYQQASRKEAQEYAEEHLKRACDPNTRK